MKKLATYTALALLLIPLACSCSKKGAVMPKHRKRTHCDCPHFGIAQPPQQPDDTAQWM